MKKRFCPLLLIAWGVNDDTVADCFCPQDEGCAFWNGKCCGLINNSPVRENSIQTKEDV